MASPQGWQLYTGGHLGQVYLPYQNAGTILPVTALAPADSDTVWAVLHDNLVVYQQQCWRRVTTCTHILADARPVHAISWWRNQLWLAGNGLWTFHRDILQQVAGLPEDWVIAIECDAQQRLVVGFEHAGIWCSADGRQWSHIQYPEHLGLLHALICDSHGQIWITVQGAASASTLSHSIKRLLSDYTHRSWTSAPIMIWSYNPAADVWTARGAMTKPVRVITMTLDRSQRVWLGTEGDGVWHQSMSSWTHLRRSSRQGAYRGLPSNDILGLYADAHERIWSVHVYGIELGVYESEVWRSAFIAPGVTDNGDLPLIWVPDHTTAGYYQLEYERIWIGTGTGEVGWIDVTATNQLVVPPKTLNYEPIRVDLG